MKDLEVPSEEDWGNYKADLDQDHAHRIFFGKTREEVSADFERNIIERTDELRFMPPIPFRYYMIAFRDFVLSSRLFEMNNEWDVPDAASCFLNLIADKLEGAPEAIAPIMGNLMPAIEYGGSNQALYKANEDIYGNFSEKLERIRALYRNA